MKCDFGVRVRSVATGSEFALGSVRAPPTGPWAGYWGFNWREWELIADDGFVYGWVPESDLSNPSVWIDLSAPMQPATLRAASRYGSWGVPATRVTPECECGGTTANTTHSSWCPLNVI